MYAREERYGTARAGIMNQCTSRCVQNGKPCPIYETCTMKREVRKIL